MCIPKPPKPPAPPAMPDRSAADMAGENERRRLSARRGFAAMIRTGPNGARDFGKNSQAAGVVGGSAQRLGANQ